MKRPFLYLLSMQRAQIARAVMSTAIASVVWIASGQGYAQQEDQGPVLPLEKPAGAAPAEAPAGPKTSPDVLLSNPIPGREEFKYLYLRRTWLAGQGGKIEAFEQLAEEFASKGAYFSAVELLWFADKLTTDPAKQAVYQTKSQQWVQMSQETDRIVEEGLQIFAAGQRYDAIKKFYEAIKLNPYCEKAHYQVANTHFLIFIQEQARSETEIPMPVREKIFRLAYEQLQYTIAIDPMFYDAFYLLSNIREILADDKEFLAASQVFTNRAMEYRNEVLPPLEQIETGSRDHQLFADLGKGFETVGIFDYAVFCYQIAISKGNSDPDVQQRLAKLLQSYFTRSAQ